MPPTNDWNEGEVGAYRVAFRHKPNLSVNGHNARRAEAQNDTSEYMAKEFTSADHKFVRSECRLVDESHTEEHTRNGLAAADTATAAHNCAQRTASALKKATQLQALVNTVVLTDPGLNYARTTCVQLRAQLAWHRRFVDTGPKDEKLIKQVKDLPTKPLLFPELVQAITRYRDTPALQERAEREMAKARLALNTDDTNGMDVASLEGQAEEPEDEDSEEWGDEEERA